MVDKKSLAGHGSRVGLLGKGNWRRVEIWQDLFENGGRVGYYEDKEFFKQYKKIIEKVKEFRSLFDFEDF